MVTILAICCYKKKKKKKLLQNLVTWNNKDVFSQDSLHQEFRSSLVGWLWFQNFQEAAIKMSAGVAVIRGLAGTRKFTSKEARSHGSQASVHCCSQVLATWTFPQGCLSALTTHGLASSEWVLQRVRKSSNDFSDLALRLISHYLYHVVLVTQTNPDTM